MAKITVSFMRDIENKVRLKQITYSRMVEMLNEKAAESEDLWASGKVRCDLCTHEWIAVRHAEINALQCPNCNNLSTFTMPEDL